MDLVMATGEGKGAWWIKIFVLFVM